MWSLTSLRTKPIRSFRKSCLLPPKRLFRQHRPIAEVSGLCCWATLFHLFPYERIDAHLSVARKWGRLCYIDEPISLFLDLPDHRCSSPQFIPGNIDVVFNAVSTESIGAAVS